jgi:release factor glutamine methyltransferase
MPDQPAFIVPTVASALAEATRHGLPRSEAQWLLARLLGQPRAWLLAHDDVTLDTDESARWHHWLAQRLDGVPLAYLYGEHEFHGLALRVTPDVLDPRPDTETLVDWALDCLADAAPGAPVLDLGTGSGAVALAIQHRRPEAAVSAVEVSPAALAVARSNGERLGLAVRWLRGSWFAPVAGEQFALIVSNPPYIADDDPHLAALRHEPRLALTSGTDGLDAIRHLIAQAPAHLRPGGWLLLEHGHTQSEAVAALLAADARYGEVAQRRDLAGTVRCTGARRAPERHDAGTLGN